MDRTRCNSQSFTLFYVGTFCTFHKSSLANLRSASSIGALSLYNNGECTNRWRDKSRQSVGGRESVKGRTQESGRKRETKEARDRTGRVGRCIIVTFTLGQVRSIVMDKLHGREEQADFPCCCSLASALLFRV